MEAGHERAVTSPKSQLLANTVLVWCFEGAMKQDTHEQRVMLRGIAESYGWKCFFCKKAATFLRWLEGRSDSSVVLIADWREVKPISEGIPLEQQTDVHIYISPRCEKAYLNAKSWVQGQTRFKQISLLADLSQNSVAELAWRCFSMGAGAHEEGPRKPDWTVAVEKEPMYQSEQINGKPFDIPGLSCETIAAENVPLYHYEQINDKPLEISGLSCETIAAENVPLYHCEQINGKPLDISWLSYGSLVKLLQNPQMAAVVEQVLKQVMRETRNEPYED
ncbi:unnamed protein product [Symbiodinium natans]|uniref:Uncharacterized protein n=1 Tax=Symbiodinium natans TaxID=878477 RepID=A0A812MP45_9DINO|nr:unnamed protein product [Symbiodinium natans]